MMLTTILVSVFYCVDALYSERRDRSILFWKSLPVSDVTAVLAKITIPLIIVPLLSFALAVGMQVFMMVVSSVVLLGSGLPVAPLWSQLPVFQMSALLLYHLLTAHTLWPAPIYAWFLLVSGWARRAPFLWAVLPMVAIAGLEAIVFHTSHFAVLVGYRFIGANAPADMGQRGVFPTNPMAHIMPARFLMSPGLWIGLAITAIFLYAAVRLRRYRAPI
jgi:ABC-2 type transport system permease protein